MRSVISWLSQTQAYGLLRNSADVVLLSCELIRRAPVDGVSSLLCDSWVLFCRTTEAFVSGESAAGEETRNKTVSTLLVIAHDRLGLARYCTTDLGRLLKTILLVSNDLVVINRALYCLYGFHYEDFSRPPPDHGCYPITLTETEARSLYVTLSDVIPEKDETPFWKKVVDKLEGSFTSFLQRGWVKDILAATSHFLDAPLTLQLTADKPFPLITPEEEVREHRDFYNMLFEQAIAKKEQTRPYKPNVFALELEKNPDISRYQEEANFLLVYLALNPSSREHWFSLAECFNTWLKVELLKAPSVLPATFPTIHSILKRSIKCHQHIALVHLKDVPDELLGSFWRRYGVLFYSAAASPLWGTFQPAIVPGCDFLALGRDNLFQLSLDCFQRALVDSPNSWKTSIYLGKVKRKLGFPPLEYLPHFKDAVTFSQPNMPDPHYYLLAAVAKVLEKGILLADIALALDLAPGSHHSVEEFRDILIDRIRKLTPEFSRKNFLVNPLPTLSFESSLQPSLFDSYLA